MDILSIFTSLHAYITDSDHEYYIF